MSTEEMREVEAGIKNEHLDSVEESQACEPEDSKAKSRRLAVREEMRAKCISKGLSPEDADELLTQKAVRGSGQRKLSSWATPCSPEFVAFFEGRTEKQLREDSIKVCRVDGGSLGLEARYAQLISEAPTTADAARLLAEHTARRMASLRRYLVAIENELLRRQAVASGVDPKTVRYLKVTTPDNA